MDYGHSLRKGLNTCKDFHPGLILLNAGILSRMHFRHIVNVGPKRKAWECMPFTTDKMIFYASLTSEKTILLNIHICTNSHKVVRSSH